MALYIFLLVLLAALAVLNAVVPLPGFSVLVPLVGTLMSTQQAVTFIIIYFFFTGIVLTFAFRHYLRPDLVISLMPASVVGAVAGSFLSASLNELLLTSVILGFVLYFFTKKLQAGRPHAVTPNGVAMATKRGHTLFIGALSSFLQGGGFGGADIRNSYLYAHNLSLQEVRATTAAIGTSIFVVSLLVRGLQGSLVISHAWLYIFLVPIAIASSYIGRHITHRLSADLQYKIIVGLMALSIALLIGKLTTLL